MSNMEEIKRRLDRIKELGNRAKGRLTGLKGPEGERLKKKAKKEGTKVGVGVGVSFFGLMVAVVASVYVLGVIILLVNIALDRLWLSALIVVGGFLLIGCGVIAIGAGIAGPAAKELSKATQETTAELKQIGEDMKAEADELQKVLKAEAEVRQKQVQEMVGQAKAAAPVLVPAAAGAMLLCHIVKKKMRSRKETRRILKVIEIYEEAKAEREEF